MYAGDKTCEETWKALSANARAALIDVRTTREWEAIGTPDLAGAGKEAIFIEWQQFPTMAVNPEFAQQADAALKARGVTHDDPVFLLCRSGARSQSAAAALTAIGYRKAYNIIAGFEGPQDGTGQRGTVAGWQFDGLPWKAP